MDKSKQKQELKTSNYVGLIVAISIVVILVGGLALKNLGAKFLLNSHVLNQKNVAKQTLNTDLTAVQSITQQYQQLTTQSQLLKDALPTESDVPGLANAVEVMAGTTGAQLKSVGSSVGLATPTATTGPLALPITISAAATYANLTRFLAAIESSVRPIHITDIQLAGTNALLSVTIDGSTFYQTPATFNVKTETVKK